MNMIIVVRMLMRMMVIIKVMIVMRMAAPCARVCIREGFQRLAKLSCVVTSSSGFMLKL